MGAQLKRKAGEGPRTLTVTRVDPATGAEIPPVVGEPVCTVQVEVRPDDGLALWQEWCRAKTGKGKKRREYVVGQLMGAFKISLSKPEALRKPGELGRFTVDLNPIVAAFIEWCEAEEKKGRKE